MRAEPDYCQPPMPQMLRQLREVFEVLLRGSLGSTQTAGTCLYAALFLWESLTHFVPGCRSYVRGGAGGRDGGCRDRDGIFRGHYWLEVHLPDGRIGAADITADQFGYPAVVWLEGADRLLRYAPGNQSIVDDHLAELRAECETVSVGSE